MVSCFHIYFVTVCRGAVGPVWEAPPQGQLTLLPSRLALSLHSLISTPARGPCVPKLRHSHCACCPPLMENI